MIERRDILEGVVARVVSLSPLAEDFHEAVISFAVEIVGRELTQLLNVLFGNISLLPGIRLVDVRLGPSLLAQFAGPAFGRDGLRELLGVAERPLLATALKPMGLSAVELAEIAGQCATGGIDIIKDDHGLSDQLFCPFAERVKRCANAV
ncbi:MAG: RuBisCO large subunit C-terminal-like domain-containing protein, partial [Polyangiaceae bacterium]|nr:RuBisCO large subunit C-terminal-like domain-containing protein [Polyangiaceae bacterium]